MAAKVRTHDKLNALLLEQGGEPRRQAFIKLREKYKREGMKPVEARNKALMELPPPDPDYRPESEAASQAEVPQPPAHPAKAQVVAKEIPVSTPPGATPVVPMGPPVKKPDVKISRSEAIAKVAGKKVSARAEIEFVLAFLEVEDVTFEDAPSASAWSSLKAARKDSDILRDIFRAYYSKLLPSQKEVERDAQFSDDGSEIIDLAERLRKQGEPTSRDEDGVQSVLRSGAEDVGSEPPI